MHKYYFSARCGFAAGCFARSTRKAPAKRDRLGAIGITPPEMPTVFNPRSPVRGATRGQRATPGSCEFQSTLPVWGATAKMHRFFFCIFGKKGIFCDILQIGRHLQGIGRKRRGDFLSRSVRTSRGKYGYLAFAFRESGGLRENRRFYSQSVLFSFRIDCQGSRIADCPFRGP